MSPCRFLLLIAVESDLLRAALVTRELRIAASAQQRFQISGAEFDPLEVWYKTKRVIAACLDIGRTLPREILGLAMVGGESEFVVWLEQAGEVRAVGIALGNRQELPEAFNQLRARVETLTDALCGGDLRTWLVWNLTGEYVALDARVPLPSAFHAPRLCAPTDARCFGRTPARGPLGMELPVVAVPDQNEALACAGVRIEPAAHPLSEADRVIVGAAALAFDVLKANEFVREVGS